MASKVLLVFVAVQWFAISGNSLFQGISFQKGFELNFKPLPREPLVFLKEKWSPFGEFGKKFAIEKRSIDDMIPVTLKKPVRPAPVVEHIEEIEEIGTEPLLILPKPPVVSPSKLPSPMPPQVLPEETSHPPLPVPMPIIVTDLPPLPSKSHIVPPISTNMVIIQPTKVVNNHVLSGTGLYTDISRVESVKEHINAVKPSPPPKKSPPLLPVSSVSVAPIISPPPAVPEPPKPTSSLPPKPVSPPPVVAPEVPAPPPSPKPIPPPPPVPPNQPEPLPPKPVAVEEEKKEILLKDSPFIKGSKMALQFGTVFLTLMAQFLDSARASIDIMTNPPPKFKN